MESPFHARQRAFDSFGVLVTVVMMLQIDELGDKRAEAHLMDVSSLVG